MKKKESKVKDMVQAFQIYKEGVTLRDIFIVYDPKEPFDIQAKKAFYESLGYTVTNVKQ